MWQEYTVKWKSLNHVWLFVTPWTVACQAPLFMEFSRQEYWSGLPCPLPGDLPNLGVKPRSAALQADSSLSEPPGKPKNTGVGSLSLLQEMFLTQESNQVSCIAGGSFTNWAIRKAHAGWGQTISACTEPFLLQWLLIYAPHWSWAIVGRNEVSIQTDPILGRQWWGPKVFKRRHGRCVCVLVALWPHGL